MKPPFLASIGLSRWVRFVGRARMIATALVALLLVVAAGALVSGCGKSNTGPGSTSTKQKYHCAMHPTYVSDRPGDCPICNMKLVPIKESDATAHPAATDDRDTTPHSTPGMESAASSVPGHISIHLSPEKRQLIGLKLSKVEKRDLARTLRTAALVEHDETRDAKIAPRFAGWVRKLHVNFTGAPVAEGEPLFTVYSPELFSTENEYLVAWRAVQQLPSGASAIQKESAESMLEAARLRLALLEIGEEEIQQLQQRGKASAELPFRSPFSGHVIVKNAVEGKAFMAGESLYEISDLSHIWLRAYVFEFEMPLVSEGQEAVINFPYLNRSFMGKVTFIYPHIEPQTRRGAIRLELDNHGHLIRPDMWANVEIKVQTGVRLCVPASSVINTGQRYVAFVESADQHLEPREVELGMKTDDYYEVLSGLKEGEEVVSRALFLVDSESQLKAAIAGMGTGGGHEH